MRFACYVDFLCTRQPETHLTVSTNRHRCTLEPVYSYGRTVVGASGCGCADQEQSTELIIRYGGSSMSSRSLPRTVDPELRSRRGDNRRLQQAPRPLNTRINIRSSSASPSPTPLKDADISACTAFTNNLSFECAYYEHLHIGFL